MTTDWDLLHRLGNLNDRYAESLADTREELAAVKSELAAVKSELAAVKGESERERAKYNCYIGFICQKCEQVKLH